MIDTTYLHPMIVHFPIALLIFGFLSDLTGLFTKKEFFYKMAFYLLIGGTLGVIAAYITGGGAEEMVTEAGALEKTLNIHENSALITVWIMSVTAFVRITSVLIKKYSRALRYISLVVFAAGIFSVARTGYYGGELVYKHAAGVQLTLDNQSINGEQQNNLPDKNTTDIKKENTKNKEEDED